VLNQMARHPVRLALPLLILTVAAPSPVRAQEPAGPATQREHVVRRGDTLWDIARAYLQNPFLWPLIYEANRNVVENPHWIYPAERLIIPAALQRPRGEPVGEPITEDRRIVIPPSEPDPASLDEEPVAEDAGVIGVLDMRRPVVTLAEYRSAPWLSATAAPEMTGRIAALVDPAAAADRLPSTLHPNTRVRVTATAQPGDSLLVVRHGRRVADLGEVVQPLGVLLVESVSGDALTARMVRQYGDARVGDAVMRLPAVPEIGLGRAEPIANGPEGHLLQFTAAEPLYGTTDIGFISLGRASGVGIGDEFGVYVSTEGAGEPTHVGALRVIRVDERSATVRVLGASSTALRDGLPVRMTHRMP
jgi:hypothetical protein